MLLTRINKGFPLISIPRHHSSCQGRFHFSDLMGSPTSASLPLSSSSGAPDSDFHNMSMCLSPLPLTVLSAPSVPFPWGPRGTPSLSYICSPCSPSVAGSRDFNPVPRSTRHFSGCSVTWFMFLSSQILCYTSQRPSQCP